MHAAWEHHRPDIMPGPELQPLSSSLAWPWGPQGGASSPPPTGEHEQQGAEDRRRLWRVPGHLPWGQKARLSRDLPKHWGSSAGSGKEHSGQERGSCPPPSPEGGRSLPCSGQEEMGAEGRRRSLPLALGGRHFP